MFRAEGSFFSSIIDNMTKKERAIEVTKLLGKKYPVPKSELKHINEMQFAIAVTLSAQTTDKKVNEVTKTLFKKYKTWEDLDNANLGELTQEIRQVNFHIGKAERLIKMAYQVLSDFEGELPRKLDELVKLPGIARKSANVILSDLWDISEGIVVDTHVSRVSNRLGLTLQKNPVKIEKDLMDLIPKKSWRNFSGAVVLHGRYICKARRPDCGECVLNEVCPSAFSFD